MHHKEEHRTMICLVFILVLFCRSSFSAPIDDGLLLDTDIRAEVEDLWNDQGSGDDVTDIHDTDWSAKVAAKPHLPAPLMFQSVSASRSRVEDLLSPLMKNDIPTSFQCGVRPEEESTYRGRIVEGITATTRWPWMVQILRKEDRELICGGTLLSDRHVITAGHCIMGAGGKYGSNDLIIRIGDHHQDEIEPLEQDANIDCLFVHPNYNPATLMNDIAILKLKVNEQNPIKFSADLLPACLPKKREFKNGHNCFITGWGYRDFVDYFYGSASPSLKEAKVPLLGNRKCRELGRTYGTELTKKMQCAGYLSGTSRADTCKKDSGGPLICQNKEGVWKLWGITSWGDNTFCEESPDLPSPGVYTRVDKYLSWIDNKLGESCPASVMGKISDF